MADELVQYEVRDRIAEVTIANGKANALAPQVIEELGAALTRAEDAGESEVGALLITGAPGMFSGGFDLKVMRSSAAAAGKLVTDGGELITRLLGSPVPVVIACSGHAVAAFRIGLIETEIGMVLPVWAAELARERLSRRHLQLATVGAKMYDPAGALDAGYLDAVVEPDQLEEAARAAAARWAAFPRNAYRGQVRVNRGAVLGRLADAIAVDRGRAFDVPV
jgi:enoyl-CoA hydratase